MRGNFFGANCRFGNFLAVSIVTAHAQRTTLIRHLKRWIQLTVIKHRIGVTSRRFLKSSTRFGNLFIVEVKLNLSGGGKHFYRSFTLGVASQLVSIPGTRHYMQRIAGTIPHSAVEIICVFWHTGCVDNTKVRRIGTRAFACYRALTHTIPWRWLTYIVEACPHKLTGIVVVFNNARPRFTCRCAPSNTCSIIVIGAHLQILVVFTKRAIHTTAVNCTCRFGSIHLPAWMVAACLLKALWRTVVFTYNTACI